jgi:hypothetical protein
MFAAKCTKQSTLAVSSDDSDVQADQSKQTYYEGWKSQLETLSRKKNFLLHGLPHFSKI